MITSCIFSARLILCAADVYLPLHEVCDTLETQPISVACGENSASPVCTVTGRWPTPCFQRPYANCGPIQYNRRRLSEAYVTPCRHAANMLIVTAASVLRLHRNKDRVFRVYGNWASSCFESLLCCLGFHALVENSSRMLPILPKPNK